MKKLITREQYRAIKKYDRQQMDEFLASIYLQGAADQGPPYNPGEMMDRIREFLSKEMGIGPKRWKRIENDLWTILTK